MYPCMVVGWVAPVVGLLATGSAAGPEAAFRLEGRAVYVVTPRLKLTLEAGAIAALEDRVTGEVFSSGSPGQRLAGLPGGAAVADDTYWFLSRFAQQPELYAQDKRLIADRRRILPESTCELRALGPTEAEVIYRGLGQAAPQDEIRFHVAVETPSGHVLLRATVRLADPAKPPKLLAVPVPNLSGRSVILGNGTRYDRQEARAADAAIRWANGLHSPPVAAVEGAKAVLGLWPEDKAFRLDNLLVAHAEKTDDLVLVTTAPNPGQADPQSLVSGRWRIGRFDTWLDVARGYRRYLEEVHGVRPLWEQTPAWVRRLHAVHTEVPAPEQAEAYYAKLASLVDPSRLLLFYWNGDGIILFGDHRYSRRQGRPKPAAIDALKKHGFRWIGYHPYVLMMSPVYHQERLAKWRAEQHLPEGYTFQPDYGGPPEKWHETFRAVSDGYYAKQDEAKRLWVMHPGARIVRDYLARNFGNYCRFHRMDGAYLDILGCGPGYHFPPDKKVIDGLDATAGEAAACRQMKEQNPELALMSEYQTLWVLPYVFYSWEGATHAARRRVNHPMRTALWGSYVWSYGWVRPAECALLGILPALERHDDWTIGRAQLYTSEELHHDLPPKWDAEALAYFRGSRGRWFQYRRLPYGDGYVEETPAGLVPRLVRFVGQTASPLDRPCRIQDWIAYRDDQKPIGLDPQRAYPVLLEPPAASDVRLVELPEGVFVSAIRPSTGHTVVEFGTVDGRSFEGQLRVVFNRECLGLRDALQDWDQAQPKARPVAVKTRFPGGLVFLWEKPKAQDLRFSRQFVGATGHTLAIGTPVSAWCYNSHVGHGLETHGGQTLPAVIVGPGRHRGYVEQWVALAPGARPVLRFQAAYPLEERPGYPQPQPRAPIVWTVHVNGTQVWREAVPSSPAWQAREVPLDRFAGRTVLLTLSARQDQTADVSPSHLERPAVFGRPLVDDNPHRQARPVTPPEATPAQPLLEERFAGPALDKAWSVHRSAAHGTEGKVELSDRWLWLIGQHYKHLHIARPLGRDNVAVQALCLFPPTGCSGQWNPGLALYWDKDRFVFVTGHGAEAFYALVGGQGIGRVPCEGAGVRVFEECYYFWLRIELTPAKIRCLYSIDGTQWQVLRELSRPKAYAGAPAEVIVGRAGPGPQPHLDNDAQWNTGAARAAMTDVFVWPLEGETR